MNKVDTERFENEINIIKLGDPNLENTEYDIKIMDEN